MGIDFIGHQRHEFVASETREHDILRRALTQFAEWCRTGVQLLPCAMQALLDDAAADLPEQVVASLMSEGIVDLLEPVQIDEEDRPARIVGHVSQHVVGRDPVGQARQRVAVRQHIHAQDVGIEPSHHPTETVGQPPTSHAQSTSTGLSKSPDTRASVLLRSARMWAVSLVVAIT